MLMTPRGACLVGFLVGAPDRKESAARPANQRVMSTRPTPVVTVFLASAGKLLLLRRSAHVGTYQGAWAGVSGYVERLPLDQAYVEVEEEAGLPPSDVALRGIGVPVPVEDAALQRTWLVHPFLFEIEDPDRVQTDWESQEARWVSPEEVAELQTVPGLGRALARVWPAFGDDGLWSGLAGVASDTIHGATSLAVSALDTLSRYLSRDASAPADRAIRAFAACRPSMGIFPHLAARLLLGDASPDSLTEDLQRASNDSAERAATALAPYESILTLSYSSAVKEAVLRRSAAGSALSVVVMESRPEMEGVLLAKDLAEAGVRVTVITDAQAGLFVREAGCVLVGCDAITDGDEVQNKAGTHLVVLAAKSAGVPCFAVTQTQKIAPPGFPISLEEQAPERVGEHERMRFRNLIFDRTPISLFDAVYTENGALSRSELDMVRSHLGAASLLL